jgi:hypothetical protein
MPRETYIKTLERKGEFEKLIQYKLKVHDYYKQNKHKWKTAKQLKEEGGDAYVEKAKQWARDSYHRRKADPSNIKAFLLRHAKARAVMKQVPFDLTEEDLMLPEVCPVFNRPFSKSNRRLGYSLDRIIPELGYIKGNVQVISQLANAMKWDSTREERLAFANWVLASEGGLPLAD